jgi:hypothetical protein
VVAIAVALEIGMTALTVSLDLARGAVWSAPVLAAALIAVPMAHEARPRLGTVVTLAAVWFVLGLVRHVVGDLDPQWAGHGLTRVQHYAWDAVYHAPPLLTLAVAVARDPASAPLSS